MESVSLQKQQLSGAAAHTFCWSICNNNSVLLLKANGNYPSQFKQHYAPTSLKGGKNGGSEGGRPPVIFS